jgi:hypothetical protein
MLTLDKPALDWVAIAKGHGVPGASVQTPEAFVEALAFLDSLIGSPQVHLLSESAGYFEKLRDLATSARLKGPRIHDARIAALCLHHGVSELWSADRDFSAFPQIKVRNPLVKK